MKQALRTSFATLAAVIVMTTATSAATFTPGDDPGVIVSPAFGLLAAGGEAADNYIDFGVDFSWGNEEGIFNDGGGVLAFGGVNGSGVIDLGSPVDGRIVVEGTTNQGVTDFFYAEAGFAAAGTLLLEVFDTSAALIGSAFNGPPTGTFGRTTFSIAAAGIAYFRISGSDSFGVDEISLNTPVDALTPVPIPTAFLLFGTGIAALAGVSALKRRSAKAAA